MGLRAVARDLGLSAPALYRYFASHEDLISAAVFKDLVAQVWHQQPFPAPSDEDLGPELVRQLQQKSEYFGGMAAGAVYLSLTYWTRLYGLICMEVFGQLHWAQTDAGAYFQAQLYEIGEGLGLDCPPPIA